MAEPPSLNWNWRRSWKPMGNKAKMTAALGMLVSIASINTTVMAANAYSIDGAVYRIEIKDGPVMHAGTGVLIGKNKILTNCHVVRHNGTFEVINRKTGNRYPTSSYRNLGSLDACVLEGPYFEGQPVAINTNFKNGETVWAYGYPNSYTAMSQGVMVGMLKTQVGIVMQTTSFCNPGSSGGPLVNVSGEIIGLIFGVKTEYRDHCLAIPMADILATGHL